MSLSDHSPTCSSSKGHREGPGNDDSLQLFCADITGRPFSKCNGDKETRKSTIQPDSRSNLENSQYWLRKTCQVQTLHLRSQLGKKGKKTLNLMGRLCVCCDKVGVKCWGAEKIRLLIPLGKKSKSFRDLAVLQQGLRG